MSNYIAEDARIFVAGHRGSGRLGHCAQAALARLPEPSAAHPCGARPGRLQRGQPLFWRAAPGVRLSRRGQGRRHSRQSRFPRRLHRPQSAHPIQCDRKRPPLPGQPAALSRLQLHLSQAGAAADLRRSTAGRAAGIHQPLLRRGEDRRHRDVLGLQPPIWNAFSGRHAHQSLRPGRQLRSGKLPRSARADSQSA